MREARNQVKKVLLPRQMPCSDVDQHADALIALHDLARHKLPPEQVGPSEVRILLEHFLREDTAHPGTVHPLVSLTPRAQLMRDRTCRGPYFA